MKYLKRFDEKVTMDTSALSDFKTEFFLKSYFDITLEDIDDIVIDVLDENPHLSCCVNIWDRKQFVIKFYVNNTGEYNFVTTTELDVKSWLFERGQVTKYINDINYNLNSFGLEITYISNEEHSDDTKTFGVNLFVTKLDKILESNLTPADEEKSLDKLFGFSSEDIHDWVQDFLDEYHDLSFEVIVVNHKLFMINFFEDGFLPNITKNKYPFPNEVLQFLKDRLKDYDCYIVGEPGLGDIYYSNSRKYLSLTVKREK